MNKDFWLQAGVHIIVIGFICTMLYSIIAGIGKDMQRDYDICCGGQQCSDTYYNEDLGKCINIMEERAKGFDFSWISVIIAVGVAFILLFLITWMRTDTVDINI